MAQTKWGSTVLPDPFAEFDRLQSELSNLFGLRTAPEYSGLFDRYVSPPVDVIDSAEELLVIVNVPGMEQKDVELSIASNILTIKGEKKQPEQKRRVMRDDIWTGTFQRTLSLPNTVDTEKVRADLKDGVLRISIGKRAEVKPRQIAVAIK